MFHFDPLRTARSLSLMALCSWMLATTAFADASRVQKATSVSECKPVVVRCVRPAPTPECEPVARPVCEPRQISLPVCDDEDDVVAEPAWCPPGYWFLEAGHGCWWADADYLLLWTNGNAVPALVTTNDTVPPRSEAGVLGVGDTKVLLGDDRLDMGGRSGVALTVGRWLDDTQDYGLQATWFYAGDPSDELNAAWQSRGTPVLARPFLNAATGLEDAQLVAYPNVVEGVTTAASGSYLRSVEALLRATWCKDPCRRIDLLGGYRYLGFREGLRLEEHLILRDPGGLAQIGTTVDLFDQFDVRNSFHGGELGVLTSFSRDWLSLDIATKLGVGSVSRELAIDGGTLVKTPTGGQASARGGLLALPSNMTTYKDDTFAVLPELDIKARLQVTERLSLSVGYQLMFLTNVYRTGQQIDRAVDTSQLAGVLPVNTVGNAGQFHPASLLRDSTLRAQGLTVGLSLTY